MKKKLIALVLCSMLIATGCGSTTATDTDSQAESAAAESSEDLEGDVPEFPVDEAGTVDEEMTAENLDSFIDLAEYKGLEITAAEGTAIENGMTANINYAGSIDGEYFDGGTADNYDLLIGSQSFIDDFEDQLVGHKKGDQVEVLVTFPSDYGAEDLAGQEAKFEVTINEVYVTTPDIVFQNVVDGSTVKQYPKSLVDGWTQYYIDSYLQYSTDSSLDAATLTLSDIAEAYGMEESTLNEMILTNVKGQMVAQAILYSEGISEDSEEFNEYLLNFLKQGGYESIEDAKNAGAADIQITYIGDVHYAQKILEDYQA